MRFHCGLSSSLLCFLFLFSSALEAAQPQLGRLEPFGVQRGTSRKIVLQGTRLKDAKELLFYEPGIAVKEMKALDDAKVEVELEVAPDCRVGLHGCQLVTSTGITNMRMIAIGTLPETAEVEPNNEFGKPQEISLGTTVTGIIQNEDVDHFSLELKAGQRLVVEVEGVRGWSGLRNDFFDPYVAVLDADRYEKAVADDVPLLYQDPVCTFVAPADGKYVVLIRDSSYGGAGDYAYRMHVGLFPRPFTVVPAGGQPGELVEAAFVEADGNTIKRQIQLPSAPSNNFPLVLENESGIAPSPNFVRVSPHKVTVEAEPNDTLKEPTVSSGPLPAAFCGQIGKPEDEDWFEFEAKKGQKLNVQVYARKVLRSPLDSVINVYGPKGNSIGGNDDSGAPDSLLTVNVAEDGLHKIRITDHLRRGGPDYGYRIEVTPAAPSLSLALPEVREDESVTVSVPRGNKMAVMVNAARQEFGGDLTIAMADLPAGVKVEPVTMKADQGSIPVLISAAADAPIDGTLVRLFAKPVAEQPAIEGDVSIRHKLVRGQNRRDVFGYDAPRLPLAVTEESPAQIEIVQPQVPIVRDGSMNLKIKVQRKEGFKEAIPVRLLYNPAGIGSSGSISIPADKDEVDLPMTANGSAAMGVWPVIAIATVNIGHGSIEIASSPINLEIADRPFTFEFPKTSAEQGGKAQVMVRVTVNRKLDGNTEIELLGIPAGVTVPTPKVTVNQETEEISFPVEIAADARVGQHKTLVCRATIHAPGGDIVETLGTGTLQIDPPPKKPAATTAPAAAAPTAAAAPKPLTRLEQLRKEKESQK